MERGETINNIDMSKYAKTDQYGRIEAVEVPDRLMTHITPGGVSDSSKADAFERGRMAERRAIRENDRSGTSENDGYSAAVQRLDGTREELEVEEAELVEEEDDGRQVPATRENQDRAIVETGEDDSPPWGWILFGVAFGMGLGAYVLNNYLQGVRNKVLLVRLSRTQPGRRALQERGLMDASGHWTPAAGRLAGQQLNPDAWVQSLQSTQNGQKVLRQLTAA